MNEENGWDHNVEGDVVEGPVVCVSREEELQALNEMKTVKIPGPSDVSLELIAASWGVGIQAMAEICQKVLDGFGMPALWGLSIAVRMFMGKVDIWNCSCYRAVKHLEHGMKVVEMVLEKRLCRIVSVDKMQIGFMPVRGTIDAVFILKRMQEEYHAIGKKLHMCSVDLEKAFDRVPRKILEWAKRKKGIPEVLVRSVMSLYDGTVTRVREDSELSEEFEVNVGLLQGSVLSPFPFALMDDVVTEFDREGALCELLYADDLVMMSETIEGLRNKFLKWKEAFENKCFNFNLGKTKVMVSSGITKDGLSKKQLNNHNCTNLCSPQIHQKHQLDRTRRTKHKTFKTPRTQRTRLSDQNTKPIPQ